MSINIINRALIKIGEKTVVSIEQLPFGGAAAIVYNDILKSLLSSAAWKFAIARARLSRADDASYSNILPYVYALPTDYINLIDFRENFKYSNLSDAILTPDSEYQIEGNKLLSAKKDITIRYIRRVDDINLFSPWFKEALIAKLAAEICYKVSQDQNKRNMFLQEASEYLNTAMRKNEVLNDVVSLPDNSWITCREGWDHGY